MKKSQFIKEFLVFKEEYIKLLKEQAIEYYNAPYKPFEGVIEIDKSSPFYNEKLEAKREEIEKPQN